MTRNKIKRSYLIAEDILEQFDRWKDRTGIEKQTGAQLGLWVVMRLEPAIRQQYLDDMNDRDQQAEDEADFDQETEDADEAHERKRRRGA